MIATTTRKPTGVDACQQKSIALPDGRTVELFVNTESGLIALDLIEADGQSIELHRQYAQTARGYITEWVRLPGRWTSLDADAPAMQSQAVLRRSTRAALADFDARGGWEGFRARGGLNAAWKAAA